MNNKTQKLLKIAALLAVSSFALACGTDPDAANTGSDSRISVPDGFGKSDNYIGTGAKEFVLTTTLDTELPAGFADLSEEEQAEELQSHATSKVGDFARSTKSVINSLLAEKNQELKDANPDVDPDELVKYFIYVKPSHTAGSAGEPTVIDDRVVFDVKMEMVGSLELIQLLDGDTANESFDVEFSGQSVPVAIEVSPSTDAFPKYDVLFKDGVYDIAIVFGGDYNEGRYDIETAKWTVEFLLENGWKNPDVSSFEELKYDSVPFTMPLFVEGRDIEARVYIIHSNMDDDAGLEQSILRDLVETSVKERDVVIYSGHAGTGAGMILDYQPRYELDDSEFKDIEMREDYQIYVFDGCNSYRTYVDALLENPARTYDSTDAVTTVNTTPFSAGYEVINRFVYWLTYTTQDGRHLPMSWNMILRGINDEFPDVYYGVHGVDNSPKLNPLGSDGVMCRTCDADADCGAGGNICMNYGRDNFCGVACTDSDACGEGYECISVTDDPEQFYITKQCVKQSMVCE